ncbi:hypothetical protein CMI48_02500 [Candidatus Pacearchaeota archaeon]|jgi:hypothetical protein|nr:hypothetical protein [Candidatus Pacearchaeota archaeon]|tara:strand:- start:59 stop:511 length:453 start_codon:yes stop_codon:yes gene_type:complete
MIVRRRGVSNVVITVLIILIGLAAVMLLWGFLRPALEKAGSQITGDCLTLDVEPISCEYDGSQAKVRVKRGNGEANLQKIKFVFVVGEDTKVSESTKAPGLLETATSSHTLAVAPSSVTVAGEILTDFGDPKLCPESLVKEPCKVIAAAA